MSSIADYMTVADADSVVFELEPGKFRVALSELDIEAAYAIWPEPSLSLPFEAFDQRVGLVWTAQGGDSEFTPLPRAPIFSIPADCREFATDHGFLHLLEEAPYRAAELFSGFKELNYSLEHDPDDEDWVYVEMAISLDADVNRTAEALDKFEEWLSGRLPPGEQTSVAVIPIFLE